MASESGERVTGGGVRVTSPRLRAVHTATGIKIHLAVAKDAWATLCGQDIAASAGTKGPTCRNCLSSRGMYYLDGGRLVPGRIRRRDA